MKKIKVQIKIKHNRLILVFVMMSILSPKAYSQSTTEMVKFNGSLTLSDNFYSASGIDPRQPSNLMTGILRANLTLFNQIELPFEFYYSNQQAQFQQPFNQFGISPKITDWLTLHGGYFSTRFSELTFGDLRVLGGGMELTPGNFRLKTFYGRTRQAIEPNKVSFMPEVYKQNAYGVSIGYGDVSKNFFNINLFHAIDDSISVNIDTLQVAPNENLVGSLDFGIKMGKMISLNGEVGASAFSGDTRAQKIDDISISVSPYLFAPNISTKVDAAAKLNINIRSSKYWSISFNSKWIGPGFTSLGYALMPNDLMEFTVAPNVRLLQNKLNIRSKAGIRYNNVQEQRLSTTSRFTGYLSANYQLNKVFGIDVNYTQNQMQSAHKMDTLRLSNIYNSISVSPRLSFQGLGGANNLILSYSYQNVSDKNVYTSEISDNNTNSVFLVHSLSYVSSLSFATSALYNNTQLPTLTTQIYHLSETVSRHFFKNTLNVSASIGANIIKVTETNSQMVFRVNASYTIKKFGSISFNISNNSYNGSGAITKNYNEIYGSLQYNINF